MSTNRLEAFSDGVFAIAITLLVLDIHVPEPGSGHLGHELLAAFSRLRAVDHSILIWTLLLLLGVGILPFTTSLMAAWAHPAKRSDSQDSMSSLAARAIAIGKPRKPCPDSG